jgi:hypothetical protein
MNDKESTPIQRSFRAKLPNGMTVKITPHIASGRQGKSDLAGVAARLADMLDSDEGSERELLSFLESAIGAIFPDANPSSRPRIMQGAAERRCDLVFDVEPAPGVSLIEIKSHRMMSGLNLKHAVEKIRRYVELSALRTRVRVVYLIAGRRHQLQGRALEEAGLQHDRSGMPFVLLSWDDIADRLRIVSPDDESPFEIVVIELIQFSRKLLRAILANPAALAGIDDRKFEELIATLLFDLGIQDVELTPLRQDRGRDIIIEHVEPSTGQRHRYLVECKHWVSGNKVTMRWALSLLAIAEGENATGAILLSSSGFGPKLLEQEITLAKEGLFLKDQGDVLRWVSVWERQYGSLIMEPIDPRTALGLDGGLALG